MMALWNREMADQRYEICKKCEKFKTHLKLCGICKCFMPVKTKLRGTSCPIGKWGPVR